MIIIENVDVFNAEGAIRGMRNPLNSWDKADSFGTDSAYIIGRKDEELAMKLIRAGMAHRKFLRQIFVTMDITAPLYWWKEMDTYKVATTANSTSTMHTLTKQPLTADNFSWDVITSTRLRSLEHWNSLIESYKYLESKGDNKRAKEIWRELIQDLPCSFNQMRAWTANYEVLRNIYNDRKVHKLIEWEQFCAGFTNRLPYPEFITIG